ncbi:hypothetical protein [Shewanella sp. 1180_01]|uniref:hypothetical protein n=1 Tax=Shewanella sp. 1180_01 TaxID=2604451 RepID=UPI004063E39D
MATKWYRPQARRKLFHEGSTAPSMAQKACLAIPFSALLPLYRVTFSVVLV